MDRGGLIRFALHLLPKKKEPTTIAVSLCFKYSGREDLNLRPPATQAWVQVINPYFILGLGALIACFATVCKEVLVMLA